MWQRGYSTPNYDARVCTELHNNSNPRARLYTAFKCSLILRIYTIIISTFQKMTGPKRGKAMCLLTDTINREPGFPLPPFQTCDWNSGWQWTLLVHFLPYHIYHQGFSRPWSCFSRYGNCTLFLRVPWRWGEGGPCVCEGHPQVLSTLWDRVCHWLRA